VGRGSGIEVEGEGFWFALYFTRAHITPCNINPIVARK